MLRKLTILASSVTVVALGYFFISDITRKDVIAANAFPLQVAAEPLKAGDVVVATDRGGLSRICNAVVADNGFDLQTRSQIYYNRAQRIMAWTGNLAASVGLMDPVKANDILRTSIPFVGSASSLRTQEYTYVNPTACECAIARNLSRGDRVCAVNASLIETSEVITLEDGQITHQPVERALAVNLRRHVMFVPEETYQRCNIPYTDAARIAEQRLCSDDTTMPFDVRLRNALNLIDSEPLEIRESALRH